jgi:isopentenyl diphosphate isomerase/L-lactate dehydrogenase-like FMN-dependent dehydrogenase
VSIKRQFPRWKNIKPLLGWSFSGLLSRKDRKLASCFTVEDLRDLSKKRVPRAVFDYVDGAALEEISLARAKAAFKRVEFRPHVLRNVSQIDLSQKILGKKAALPIIFAPTGYSRMMHYLGEPAVAQAAKDNDLIYALSTMGTTSTSELAQAVPDVRRWFQLYLWNDREQSKMFIDNAKRDGFEALILTVDTPISGQRIKDNKNGLTVPPKIRIKTFLDMATKPKWWGNLLTTPPLEFATFRGYDAPLFELSKKIFDPSVTMSDIKWLKDTWGGPLIVKGVQRVDDAKELVKYGVDAIVISNHGGRQMDRGTVPLETLPEMVKAVGKKMEVYIDGGITSATDVLAAIGFGAKGVLIGRAYLYALMAGGQAGVQKMIDIFTLEMETSMKLLGVKNFSEITPDLVQLRPY